MISFKYSEGGDEVLTQTSAFYYVNSYPYHFPRCVPKKVALTAPKEAEASLKKPKKNRKTTV